VGDCIEDLPDDAECTIKGSAFKLLINERHDMLLMLKSVRGQIVQCIQSIRADMPCPSGLCNPDVVSVDGRTFDEVRDEEKVEVRLNCECPRCRLAVTAAAVTTLTEGWDYDVAEDASIKGSYRLPEEAQP